MSSRHVHPLESNALGLQPIAQFLTQQEERILFSAGNPEKPELRIRAVVEPGKCLVVIADQCDRTEYADPREAIKLVQADV